MTRSPSERSTATVADVVEHPTDDALDEDRQFVIALARGLAVLQAFQPGDDLLTHAELSARTRLPKATLTRYTHTLTRLGFLSPGLNCSGHRLEPHVLALGFPVLARLGVRDLARPLLQTLASNEGVSAALGMRDGIHIVFVERVRAPSHSALQQDIGTRVPIASTAQGRAYLAGLSPVERMKVIAEIRASGLPEWWSPVRAALAREMKRHEKHGYCFGGDWLADIHGVAVPLLLPGGTVLTLGCGAARERMPEPRLHALGSQLLQIVKHLTLNPDVGL